MGQLSWVAGWGRISRREASTEREGSLWKGQFLSPATSKDKNLPPVGWGWSFPLGKWGDWGGGGPKSWGTLSASSATPPSPSIVPSPMRKGIFRVLVG